MAQAALWPRLRAAWDPRYVIPPIQPSSPVTRPRDSRLPISRSFLTSHYSQLTPSLSTCNPSPVSVHYPSKPRNPMPPARHPPPASATLTPLSSHCLSLFPSPYSLRTPLTFVHPSPRSPLEPHSFFTPYSPALRRKPAEKSGPSYLSPSGPRPGLHTSPWPDPPAHAQLSTRARPTPAGPEASQLQPKSAPPHLRHPGVPSRDPVFVRRPQNHAKNTPAAPQEFFGKTLTRAKQPHFTPSITHPSTVPNTPHFNPMTGDNQLADPLPGRTR